MGRYGCKFSGYFHLHDLGLASHPAVHKKTYLGLSVGTAVEHHALYQYQFVNTKEIFMGHIQTETP